MKKPSFLERRSLKRNIIIVISLLIPGSILLVSSLIYNRYTADLLDQSNTQQQQIIEQVAINTDTYLDELLRLCLSPYYSEDVMQQLQSIPFTKQEQLEKKRIVEGYLREVMTIPRKDILRVYILTDDVYYSSKTAHTLNLSDNFEDEVWFNQAVNSNQSVFIPVYEERSGGYTLSIFSIIQQLKSLESPNQVLGVIRVDANYAGIEDVCDKVSIMENGALFIVDSKGNTIYQHSNLADNIMISDIFSLAESNLNSTVSTEIENEDYFINSYQITTTDWTIIAVNSYSDLTKNASITRKYIILFAILCSIVGIVFAVILVQRFLKPLYSTVALMRHVQGGDLSVRADSAGTSEIAYLNKSFNDMLERIQSMIEKDKHLTKQVYEAKYLQKEAQYDALYNQIRPHFLFNTLNTISLLIKTKREQKAIQSINKLSVMLRGLMNTDREITLASEFKILESYLSLQKQRHGSLSYSINLDPDNEDYLLPALSIQPIVENAYIHGFDNKNQDAEIRVSTVLDEKHLKIIVEDNGIGIDEELIHNIEKRIEEDEYDNFAASTRGIGLINISKRIKLKFGNVYGLKINSTINKGTVVTVFLPLDRRS